MIRVLIAEDHAVVRAGLEQLLGGTQDIEVVAAAPDGMVAVELVAEHAPDVVLMDLHMPGLDGIEATRRIVQAAPATRVVVLTSFSDRERILRALDAGAMGYLLKDAEPDELLNGIRTAARGDSPLAPRAASVMLTARQAQVGASDAGHAELTEREREVLQLVGDGLGNKQIALRLAISEKTVKAHLTSVYRALGVTDRTQAALWVQRRGFRSPGEA
jgi:DNA-binding NarL/FixJ family response regulator